MSRGDGDRAPVVTPCKHCGAPIEQRGGRGRRRSYCPDRGCQAAAKREREIRRATPGLEGALARAEDLYERMEKGLANAIAPLAAALFALLLWLWHLPRPYRATFESDLLYWTMHLTLLASALCLWHVLICRERRELQRAVVAGIVTVVQMGLLGAAITLAPRLLYDPHVLTTQLWGLTPLEDQQLGGLIMWVPGCAIVILAALAAVGRTLLSPASSVQR